MTPNSDADGTPTTDNTRGDDTPGPFEAIRENPEPVETLADRDDRIGAIARYILDVAHGDTPDPYDCRLAGLPDPRGEDRK